MDMIDCVMEDHSYAARRHGPFCACIGADSSSSDSDSSSSSSESEWSSDDEMDLTTTRPTFTTGPPSLSTADGGNVQGNDGNSYGGLPHGKMDVTMDVVTYHGRSSVHKFLLVRNAGDEKEQTLKGGRQARNTHINTQVKVQSFKNLSPTYPRRQVDGNQNLVQAHKTGQQIPFRKSYSPRNALESPSIQASQHSTSQTSMESMESQERNGH